MRAAPSPPLVETVWKRELEFGRTLVNIIAPLRRVHIECYSRGRRLDYPEFSALEWDEKRREVLAVLQLEEGDITMATIALDEQTKKLEEHRR